MRQVVSIGANWTTLKEKTKIIRATLKEGLDIDREVDIPDRIITQDQGSIVIIARNTKALELLYNLIVHIIEIIITIIIPADTTKEVIEGTTKTKLVHADRLNVIIILPNYYTTNITIITINQIITIEKVIEPSHTPSEDFETIIINPRSTSITITLQLHAIVALVHEKKLVNRWRRRARIL